MSMFRTILENELERRKIGIRDAAKEIGISHTTLISSRDGTRTMDLGTALRIAKWVGVPLSTMVEDANPQEFEQNKLTQSLFMVLKAVPDLEQVFMQASDGLADGSLTTSDFTDIVEYAVFKIQRRREMILREQGTAAQTNK